MTLTYYRQWSSTCNHCKIIYTPMSDVGFGMEICPKCDCKMRDLSKDEKKAKEKWEKNAFKHAYKESERLKKERKKNCPK
jgi:hypothetical protein